MAGPGPPSGPSGFVLSWAPQQHIFSSSTEAKNSMAMRIPCLIRAPPSHAHRVFDDSANIRRLEPESPFRLCEACVVPVVWDLVTDPGRGPRQRHLGDGLQLGRHLWRLPNGSAGRVPGAKGSRRAREAFRQRAHGPGIQGGDVGVRGAGCVLHARAGCWAWLPQFQTANHLAAPQAMSTQLLQDRLSRPFPGLAAPQVRPWNRTLS